MTRPAHPVPAHRTPLVAVAAIAVLAALGTTSGCESSTTEPDPLDVTWDTDAEFYRGNNGRLVVYRCPANGTPGWVWGTDVYSDDSSVCTAAVHAGRITLAQGGVVTFEVRPGQASYQGSTRNGITSDDWDEPWDGSFVFS
jgi:hypothetical protein